MNVKWCVNFSLFSFLFFSVNCKDGNKNNIKAKEIINQKGFVIKTEQNSTGVQSWYFVSAKEIDKNSWSKDLNTKNLGSGVKFSPLNHSNFPISFVQRHLDTIDLNNDKGRNKATSKLMVFPFKLSYKLKSDSGSLYNNFLYAKNSKILKFNYSEPNIDIINIEPLAEPKWKIQECECKQNSKDLNDYLYKICKYLKQKEDKFANVCSYKIREISSDTLNGEMVIKVTLDCCYLGDIAYFDIRTKKIKKFKYGAI